MGISYNGTVISVYYSISIDILEFEETNFIIISKCRGMVCNLLLSRAAAFLRSLDGADLSANKSAHCAAGSSRPALSCRAMEEYGAWPVAA